MASSLDIKLILCDAAQADPNGIVLNIGPMPLSLGHYQWRLDMNDQTEFVSFTVANC